MACRRHVAILAMMAQNIKHQLIPWEQDCKIQVSTEFFLKLYVVIDMLNTKLLYLLVLILDTICKEFSFLKGKAFEDFSWIKILC